MKSRCLLLGAALSLCAALPATAQVVLSQLDVAYTQNFDTLSNTASSTTNSLAITGWSLTESGGGARDNEQYAVDTGGSSTGDIYSYGSTSATDRALGSVQSGTLIPIFGAQFTNSTGATITSLAIAYRGEEWRLGTASRTDKLTFEYSLDATGLTNGTWTNVASLDFTTPVTATTGAKDGNNAANYLDLSASIQSLSIANGGTFWVRWTDFNATAADDGLAVDNFSLTPAGVAAVPEPSTYAAVFGALALAGVIVRRRFARV
ncbi:MAG: PEP-CTERM sorting domain-containing protein [Opitutae bacterium]|nr:PEP-CTERM sorting domain-containing protein [Opitutae bacterium]